MGILTLFVLVATTDNPLEAHRVEIECYPVNILSMEGRREWVSFTLFILVTTTDNPLWFIEYKYGPHNLSTSLQLL